MLYTGFSAEQQVLSPQPEPYTADTHTHTHPPECLLTGVAGEPLWTWEVSRRRKAWRRSRQAYLAPRSASSLSGDLEEPAAAAEGEKKA